MDQTPALFKGVNTSISNMMSDYMKTNHTLWGKLSAGPGDKRNPSLAIQAAGSLTLASSCFPASLSGLSGASGVLRLSPTAIYELMMLQVTIVLRCQVSSE